MQRLMNKGVGKVRTVPCVLCALIVLDCAFAQSSTSQIQQSQQLIQKEEDLRRKIQEPRKFYIKKIIIQGVSLITKESLRQIISPFEKHWLNKEDIQLLIESLSQAYLEKNAPLQPAQISYEIKGKSLLIKIKE